MKEKLARLEKLEAAEFLIEQNLLSYFLLRISFQSMGTAAEVYRRTVNPERAKGEKIKYKLHPKPGVDKSRVKKWALLKLQATWRDRANLEAQVFQNVENRKLLVQARRDLIRMINNG